MPYRPVADKTAQDWKALADIFENLLGGNALTRHAAKYLRDLANNALAAHDLTPLPWHESGGDLRLVPEVEMDPHPVVLAVLSPSVPLRAVWHRRRG